MTLVTSTTKTHRPGVSDHLALRKARGGKARGGKGREGKGREGNIHLSPYNLQEFYVPVSVLKVVGESRKLHFSECVTFTFYSPFLPSVIEVMNQGKGREGNESKWGWAKTSKSPISQNPPTPFWWITKYLVHLNSRDNHNY